MSLKMRSLSEVAHLLETDIHCGLFTPFLGAGASSLRSINIDLYSYPWKQVALTLTAISSRLSDRSREFLYSFTKQRLSLSASETSSIIPTTHILGMAGIDGTDLSESLLVQFQAEIVRATVRLTNYFGARFSQENPSVHHLEDYSVEFDLNSEDVIGALARDCPARLFAAAGIALKIQSKTGSQRESPFFLPIPGVDRQLEVMRLYHKLLTLIAGLLGKDREIYENEFAKHRIGGRLPISREVERGTEPSFGRLRLDAIQWLSDLLWYTLRYWVPCYPTTAELAFELSLAVADAPPRRAELAQAAQALENLESELAAKIVGDLVAYCERGKEIKGVRDWQTKAFYCSIAVVLLYQFELYRETVAYQATLDPLAKFRNDDKDDRKLRIPVPIAFTTNFDNALENTFTAHGISFHTISPVLRRATPEDESPAAPIWFIHTHNPECHEKIQEWQDICDDNGNPKITFNGPIIVKLHGSPSLALDKAHQHWIVLSEFSYLQALGAWTPSWLEQQLSSGKGWNFRGETGRSLWFLGHSLSDWNVRLSLSNRGNLAKGERWNMVNLENDDYRHAILERLGVARHIGDLSDIPLIIWQSLDDQKIYKTQAIISLMEELREVLVR